MIRRRTAELGMASATALFGITVMIGAREYGIGWSSAGPEPGMFPFAIGTLVLLASLGNGVLALVQSIPPGREAFISCEQFRLVAGFAVPIVGFVIASLTLGLYVGTALYMAGTLVFQNGYPAWKAGIIAIGLPVFFYFLIEKAFRVSLLKGPLEAALGLW